MNIASSFFHPLHYTFEYNQQKKIHDEILLLASGCTFIISFSLFNLMWPYIHSCHSDGSNDRFLSLSIFGNAYVKKMYHGVVN